MSVYVNRRASGLVLSSGFLAVLDHSAMGFIDINLRLIFLWNLRIPESKYSTPAHERGGTEGWGGEEEEEEEEEQNEERVEESMIGRKTPVRPHVKCHWVKIKE